MDAAVRAGAWYGLRRPELTVELERDPGVQERIVWFRVFVREFTSETPVVYPAQRVGDGPIRIPFPEAGRAFTLRIDGCIEGMAATSAAVLRWRALELSWSRRARRRRRSA